MILQKEGGILIDLELIGCKKISALARLGEPFQTLDGRSMIGCPPNQYDAPRKIVSDAFILPDQIFTTELSSDPLVGVCFSRFKGLPVLNEALRKIHTAPYEKQTQEETLHKNIFKITRLFVAISILFCLNIFVLTFFSWYQANVKKWLFTFFICLAVCLLLKILFFSKKSSDYCAKIETKSFLSLSHFDHYSHSMSPSDIEHLDRYSRFFTQRFLSPNSLKEEEKIPRTIHLIWGGVPFPESSIANVVSWMKYHPDWIFTFWTDDPSQPVPVKGMKKKLLSEIYSDSPIQSYFEESQNWGEKSDLLRYAILFREGGLYIDHDIECLHSFTALHDQCRFYASIEPFHQSPLYNSYLTMSNCLIGSAPNHPILADALALCIKKWNLGSQLFPHHDQQSTLLRTLYRTFCSFDEAVRLHISDDAASIILPSTFTFLYHFPPAFYASLKSTNYPLANHQWSNTWFQKTPSISKRVSAGSLSIFLRIFKFTLYWLAASLFSLTTFLYLYTNELKSWFLCSKRSYFSFFLFICSLCKQLSLRKRLR